MRFNVVIVSIRSYALHPGFPTSSHMLPVQGNSHMKIISRYASACFSEFMDWQGM